MFKTYSNPLPMYMCWYEYPLDIFRSVNLSVSLSCDVKHDPCDTVRLYKNTMLEDAMEFSDPLASIHAPTQQTLKIDERVATYISREMDKDTRIDEADEERF